MRILTVRQPWAWAIIHGGKDVENRVQNVAGSYRGPVAIHVALTWDGSPFDHQQIVDAHVRLSAEDGLSLPERDWNVMEPQRGHIIGVVDMVDVHPVANPHFHPICYDLSRPDGLREAAERGAGACSPWATSGGQWHLVFTNPRPLAEPIPYKGALGLRELPDDVTQAILEEVGQ